MKLKVILLFCIVSAVLCFAAIFYFTRPVHFKKGGGGVSLNGEGEGGEVSFQIKNGESAFEVGEHLFDAGLIKSVFLWNVLCKLDKTPVKTGMYKFDSNLDLFKLHKVFTKGIQVLVRVTIPEGSTVKKTAAIFEKMNICGAADFIAAASDSDILKKFDIPAKNAEGYLFPDTYYFSQTQNADFVVETLIETFYKELDGIKNETEGGALSGIENLSGNELFEKVILASIIEREYRIDEEAPRISGVFTNRLNAGMRLESCATVEYIITEINGKPHPTRIFNKDLEDSNLYNTYRYKGLPPAPISSPGRVALRAALLPEKNDFYFFRIIDAKAGRHYFSKTFDAHIKAGALLVKGRE